MKSSIATRVSNAEQQATLSELRRDGILVFFDLQEKVLAATLHNPINGGSIRWSRKPLQSYVIESRT